jgi:hypothetical protein
VESKPADEAVQEVAAEVAQGFLTLASQTAPVVAVLE